MHIDHCPKCGMPGALVPKYRKCGKPNCKCARGPEFLHGPYPTVQHHPSRSRPVSVCYINRALITGDLEARIIKLLAKEKAGLL